MPDILCENKIMLNSSRILMTNLILPIEIKAKNMGESVPFNMWIATNKWNC